LTLFDGILIVVVLACVGALFRQSQVHRAATSTFSVKAMESIRAECEKARLECERSRAAEEAGAFESERSRGLIQDQLRVSELYTRISQRPWLYVNPIDIEIRGLTPAQNPSLLYFTVENGGTTPAVNVRLYFQCIQSMVLKFDPDSVPAERETKVMIGPHAKLRATVKFEGESEVPVSNYYFYGYAKYNDVFNQEHQTLWCYRYNPARSVFEPQKQFNTVG